MLAQTKQKIMHSCEICGKQFGKPAQVRTHMLIHTGEKPHKCDTCGKEFTQTAHLKRHELIHTGVKDYKCGICGKAFSQPADLNKHIYIHTGERPFKCDVCGKDFKQIAHLHRHKRIHTGEKPHECEICGKQFAQMSYLTRHISTHSQEKPHKCDICGKHFSRSDCITRHMLTHTLEKNYSCEFCNKKFKRIECLTKHMLLHLEQRSYECNVCGKEYVKSGMLIRHMMKHTEGKSGQFAEIDPEFSESEQKAENLDALDNQFTKCKYGATLKKKLTEEGEYKCDICGEDFIQLELKIKHMLTHLDDTQTDKPYECGMCGEKLTMTNVEDSIKHMLSHTEGESIKPDGVNHTVERSEQKNIKGNRFGVVDGERADSDEDNKMKRKITEYECDICDEYFTCPEQKLKHMLSHTVETNGKSFKCGVCGEKLNTEDSSKHLLSHVEETLENDDSEENEVKDDKFVGHKPKDSDLNRSKRMKPTKDCAYKCEICGQKFIKLEQKIKHTIMHKDDNHAHNKPYECGICGEQLTNSEDSSKHMLLHMEVKSVNVDINDHQLWKSKQNAEIIDGQIAEFKNEETNVIQREKGEHKFDVCGEHFSQVETKEKHMSGYEEEMHALNKSFECGLCGEQLDSVNSSKHMLTHMEEKFEKVKKPNHQPPSESERKADRFDSQNFTNSKGFSKPLKTFTEEKSEKVKFDQTQLIESEKTAFDCQVTSSDNKMTTKSLIHPDNKPIKCNVNEKQLTNSIYTTCKENARDKCDGFDYHLMSSKQKSSSINPEREHMVSNIGDSDSQDDKDYEHFTAKRQKIGHILTHSNEIHAKNKLYECGICGEQLTNTKDSTKHMLTHTEETLNENNVSNPQKAESKLKVVNFTVLKCKFKDSNRKEANKMICVGEYEYKCDLCGKQFAELELKKKHMSTHKMESDLVYKPYECGLCGKQFQNSKDSARHMLTHEENLNE